MATVKKPHPGTISSSLENRIWKTPRKWNIKKDRTHKKTKLGKAQKFQFPIFFFLSKGEPNEAGGNTISGFEKGKRSNSKNSNLNRIHVPKECWIKKPTHETSKTRQPREIACP